MQQQPQEDNENAEKSESYEVALSSDVAVAPALEEKNVFVFLDFEVGGADCKYSSVPFHFPYLQWTLALILMLSCKSQLTRAFK
jgi:hypothetical protein